MKSSLDMPSRAESTTRNEHSYLSEQSPDAGFLEGRRCFGRLGPLSAAPAESHRSQTHAGCSVGLLIHVIAREANFNNG